MAPAKRETASEIAKRYGLADLVRTRIMARRLYLNSLARRASISYQDSIDMLDPEYSPLEWPIVSPRGYYLTMGGRNDFVASRRGLPSAETRLIYNRRLADLELARLEAAEKADKLVDRYLTRSKTKKLPAADVTEENEINDRNNNKDEGVKENGLVEDESESAIADEDEIDAEYLDFITTLYDYDVPLRRIVKRLYPYRFRPISASPRTT
ncbi:hypothetical protein BgiMline_017356 [Biomphalaria glabrata]|nr:hypothetical protein BgiMline_005031 [Biomphalaria glabrata]